MKEREEATEKEQAQHAASLDDLEIKLKHMTETCSGEGLRIVELSDAKSKSERDVSNLA